MRYTVLWDPDAADDLARLWLGSRLQSAITAAVNELDRRLAVDPTQVGESRGGNHRIAFEGPVAITFDVREQDRKVLVLDAWTFW